MDRTASSPVETTTQHIQVDASPPPGPSRTSIGKLNNFFNSRLSTTAKRPITVPAPRDSQSPSQVRSRAGSAKTKGGMSDFGSDFLGSNQIDQIGTPSDLVRFTHLGFNTSSEDFSGLLKEWKQLLRTSGISGTGSVIDPPRDEADWSSGVQNPSLAGAPLNATPSEPPPPPPASYDTTKDPRPSEPQNGRTPVPVKPATSSAVNQPFKQPSKDRKRTPPQPTAVATDAIRMLQQICTDADPTRLYRNLVKIGAGTSGDVYTAYQVGTNGTVAVKQIDLDMHPKIRKDSIINEIHVMKASRHPNFVNYIDSFLYKNEVWVVMEYLEGGSLTDVVTANFMSEGQIAAVSREICQGLDHLHRHGVIHRDIKSGNVLLSMNGDIKLTGLGYCAQIPEGNAKPTGWVGTVGMPYWAAPSF